MRGLIVVVASALLAVSGASFAQFSKSKSGGKSDPQSESADVDADKAAEEMRRKEEERERAEEERVDDEDDGHEPE